MFSANFVSCRQTTLGPNWPKSNDSSAVFAARPRMFHCRTVISFYISKGKASDFREVFLFRSLSVLPWVLTALLAFVGDPTGVPEGVF